jgi:Helix-turn-helix domain
LTEFPERRRVYFDTQAAAEYLSLSPRTLEKMRWAGDGPAFHKLGGVRYTQEDLDAWRESCPSAGIVTGINDHSRSGVATRL